MSTHNIFFNGEIRKMLYSYFMLVCGIVKTTAREAVDSQLDALLPEAKGNSTSSCPGYRGQ